ncbi:MAG: hypothetical protein FJ146_13370 [Deltaproteobacteria bacterium]|nr:hypothetical protein [Deltaproteobacteria bacterium]
MISSSGNGKLFGLICTLGVSTGVWACGPKDRPSSVQSSSASLGPFAIEPIKDQVLDVSSLSNFTLPSLTVPFKLQNAAHPVRFEYLSSNGKVDGPKDSEDEAWMNDGKIPTEFYLHFDPSVNTGNVYDPGEGEHEITVNAKDAAGRTAEVKFKVKAVKTIFRHEISANGPTIELETVASDKLIFKAINRLAPSCVDLGTGEVYRQKTAIATEEVTFAKVARPEGGFRFTSPALEEPILATEYENIKTVIYLREISYTEETSTSTTSRKPGSDPLADLFGGPDAKSLQYLIARSCKPGEKDYSCYAEVLNKASPKGLLYCGWFQTATPYRADDAPQTPQDVLKSGLCKGRLGNTLAAKLNIGRKFAFCDQ